MATTWRVTSQRQTDVLVDGGTFESMMEVNFVTIPEGTRGMVTLPLRTYTEDNVRDMIEDRVAVIKAVHEL